jgi:hypothetical protein
MRILEIFLQIKVIVLARLSVNDGSFPWKSESHVGTVSAFLGGKFKMIVLIFSEIKSFEMNDDCDGDLFCVCLGMGGI